MNGQVEERMVLDELKLALGPYMIGMTIAIISIIAEILYVIIKILSKP